MSPRYPRHRASIASPGRRENMKFGLLIRKIRLSFAVEDDKIPNTGLIGFASPMTTTVTNLRAFSDGIEKGKSGHGNGFLPEAMVLVGPSQAEYSHDRESFTIIPTPETYLFFILVLH
ncbi:MAG: hypothetical protein ACE5DO_08430 [Desulfobacterales bacterium]